MTTATQNEFATMSKATFTQLMDAVRELTAKVEALESKNQTSSTKREMTIADAELVMIGELREKSHNEAAAQLGLTYGQVYSARLGHTFKPVSKTMAEAKLEMIWGKK